MAVLPAVQQQPRMTPRGKASPKKGSLSYFLYHQLPINKSPVKTNPAVIEISRNKQYYICVYWYLGTGGKSKNERFLVVDQEGNFQLKGYNDAVAAKKARETEYKKSFGPKGMLINIEINNFFHVL